MNARRKADIVASGAGSYITKLVEFAVSPPERTARFGPQATIISPHADGAPKFKTVTGPVVVQEASTEFVTVPATYETAYETIVIQPQHMRGHEVIPAITKQVPRQVVKTPARTMERVVPAISKSETRRIPISAGQFTSASGESFSYVSELESQGAGPQTNSLKMSLLSGPQTVTVSARMQFLYDTPINGKVFKTASPN